MECEERKGALRLKRTVGRQGRGLFPRADKRLHALFKQRRGRKLKVSAFFLCINARALVMEEYGESPNPWLKKMAAKFTAPGGSTGHYLEGDVRTPGPLPRRGRFL